jgi:Zn-dependent M28 family amino/carboxypeptidase
MNPRIPLIAFVQLLLVGIAAAQPGKKLNEKEVARIEAALSADDMQGRKVFTPGIEKAGDFIAAEFKAIGLGAYQGLTNYKQTFETKRTKFINASGKINGQEIETKNIIGFSDVEKINITEISGWELSYVKEGDDLVATITAIAANDKPTVVLIHTSFSSRFAALRRFKRSDDKKTAPILFVLTDEQAVNYSIQFEQEVNTYKLTNIIGILPGKTKPNEYVVFSGHYDHLGIGKPDATGDSIYNGANDDAAGITGVISLANYFKQKNDNQRSIIFVAFTAEETGGFGSKHFSGTINPDDVVAMCNIEMIGTQSQWGANSAYITGFDKSDLINIMQKNVDSASFKFYGDPYVKQNLFYRSDNATLAALGVPAHTISTSNMDNDKTYHTQKDEFSTLDMKNMTNVIEAIGKSFATIIAGTDTPIRIPKRN